MGKRKSRKKPPSKPRSLMPLETQFDCPFCNHEKSCDVRIEKRHNTGRVSCHVCHESFQTYIHALSEPVDVYNDWVDACEAVN